MVHNGSATWLSFAEPHPTCSLQARMLFGNCLRTALIKPAALLCAAHSNAAIAACSCNAQSAGRSARDTKLSANDHVNQRVPCDVCCNNCFLTFLIWDPRF